MTTPAFDHQQTVAKNRHRCAQLEREITALAAHMYAGTYRWLCLIREFDEREGWGGEGVMSCAHWLNWQCGIALGAAREKLRVACDASIVHLFEDAHGNPLDVGRKTRAISPALRRALEARDQGCRFPGCTHRRSVHAHHITHWPDGGETKLVNLVQLCPFHHRLVHEGGFGVDVRVGEGCRFTRPDGQAMRARPPPLESVGQDALEQQNRAHGLPIAAHTCVPKWQGETIDYTMAVEGLLVRSGGL